jgi:hypothetical protein
MRIGRSKTAVVAAAGASAAIALAIGITVSTSASAASSSPAATPSGRPSGAPDWHGGSGRGGPGAFGGPWFGGRGGPGGPGGQLLHGEQVVQQGTKVVTIDEQVGKITAVSATTVTIRSSDGFTATYVVGSTTRIGKNRTQVKISAVVVGDTVRVEGVKSGGSVTASQLMDGLEPMRPDQRPMPAPNGSAAVPMPGTGA